LIVPISAERVWASASRAATEVDPSSAAERHTTRGEII
jgi:hypothetical protein